jgi:RHS repeat-associated protein
VEVYFDDFKVTQIKSPIIESTDYYPMGLEISNYTRENSLPNQYRFQGMELTKDLGINLYLTDYRSYDRALGRWNQIDPKASERESPYVAFANNPLRYMDSKGDTVIFFQAPEAAAGNGHMGMAFQNGEGNWFYFSQGATGDPSQGSLLAGSDADGGVDLLPLTISETTTTTDEDGNEVKTTTTRNPTMDEVVKSATSGQFGYKYTSSTSLNTSKEEDNNISLSAHQLQRDYKSGKEEYSLYTNNCVDACQDAVQNRTNINLPMDWDPRPNSYFPKLQNFTPGFNQQRSGNNQQKKK